MKPKPFIFLGVGLCLLWAGPSVEATALKRCREALARASLSLEGIRSEIRTLHDYVRGRSESPRVRFSLETFLERIQPADRSTLRRYFNFHFQRLLDAGSQLSLDDLSAHSRIFVAVHPNSRLQASISKFHSESEQSVPMVVLVSPELHDITDAHLNRQTLRLSWGGEFNPNYRKNGERYQLCLPSEVEIHLFGGEADQCMTQTIASLSRLSQNPTFLVHSKLSYIGDKTLSEIAGSSDFLRLWGPLMGGSANTRKSFLKYLDFEISQALKSRGFKISGHKKNLSSTGIAGTQFIFETTYGNVITVRYLP